MSKENAKLRKQFEGEKKKGDIYKKVGGKKSGYDLHHPFGLKFLLWVVYIPRYIHQFIHKMEQRGEMQEPDWGNSKCPSVEKTWDKVGDALMKQAILDENIKAVKAELETRGL